MDELHSELLITTRVYTRVIQEPEFQEEKPSIANPITDNLLSQLDWNAQQDTNIKEVRTATGTKYLVYSRPVIYSIADKFPHIIDLCVESENKESALEQFNQRKEESEKIKKERQKKVDPYLLEISQIPGVIFMAGRGSTYDKRRVAGVGDDVDVSLFLDYNSEGELANLLDELKEVYVRMAKELNVEIAGIKFLAKDRAGSSGTVLYNNESSKFEVSLDLINYKYSQDQRLIQHIIDEEPYSRDMFANYAFLGGNKGIFDEFVKRFQ